MNRADKNKFDIVDRTEKNNQPFCHTHHKAWICQAWKTFKLKSVKNWVLQQPLYAAESEVKVTNEPETEKMLEHW